MEFSFLFPDSAMGSSSRHDLALGAAKFLNLTWWHGVLTDFLSILRVCSSGLCWVLKTLLTSTGFDGVDCIFLVPLAYWDVLMAFKDPWLTLSRGEGHREGEKRKEKEREEQSVLGLVPAVSRPELTTWKLLSLFSCLFSPPKAGFVSVD